MDWQIRIALIVVGIAVIGFIVYDYQRRKKNDASKQRLIEQMRASADQKDASGFDFTGVGEVRKSPQEPTLDDPELDPVAEDQQQTDAATSTPADISIEVAGAADSAEPQPMSEPKAMQQVAEEKPEQSVTEEAAAPKNADRPTPQKKTKSPRQEKRTAPTEQLVLGEMDEEKATADGPEMVISLILRADEGSTYLGRDFMPLLLSQGLRHGDMGIFHRHKMGKGKPGPVLYSVANAINPGTFDINNIEQFETPAFAFFMTLPSAAEPLATYEGMVKTIRLLQQEMGGQILDDSKSVFTEQTHQHQLDNLREYLRKQAVQPQ